MDTTSLLMNGLMNNLLICLVGAIHPMIVGLVVLLVKRGRKVGRICPAWYIAECIPPLALMLLLYFQSNISGDYSLFVVILTLTLSHTAFIPIHIREAYTVRNYFAAAIDLVGSLLKWSMVAGFIAARDILQTANIIHSRTYTSESYAAVFGITFAILLLLQLVKWLITRKGKQADALPE